MKIKTLLPLALSVAALGGATTALAGGPDHMPAYPSSSHKVYVGAGVTMNQIGATNATDDVAAVNLNSYIPVGVPHLGWKVFVGYQVKSWLDTELSFTDPGKTAIQSRVLSDIAADDTLSVHHWMVDLDGIAHARLYSDLSGFVKAGFGFMHASFTASNLNNFPPLPNHESAFTSSSSHNNVATLNYGAGLSYEFMRTYGARVSYTRYIVSNQATDFQTAPNLISFDLTYRFNV
ncbi:MAG: porin family protein [Gammaproteobacteria bacterium]|nr:porin family protein [Gammaproteobacteria bacterium]MCH9743317.1 porin family protein [Gammaproteobacteria bacterium]